MRQSRLVVAGAGTWRGGGWAVTANGFGVSARRKSVPHEFMSPAAVVPGGKGSSQHTAHREGAANWAAGPLFLLSVPEPQKGAPGLYFHQ